VRTFGLAGITRRTLFLAAGLAAFLAMPSAAQAGKFEWHLSSNVQIDQPVEQQTPWVDDGGPGQNWWPNDTSLWVNNPTDCAWDVDDHWQQFADGSLLPGVPATMAFCQVAESESIRNTIYGTTSSWSFPKRTLGVSVRSSSPSLEVRACYEPGGCIKFAAVKEGRHYRYGGCILLRYANGDPALAEVPGANGALGVMTQGTLTVTAPKRASVTGSAEVAGGFGDFSAYCPANAAVQSAYPLTVYS